MAGKEEERREEGEYKQAHGEGKLVWRRQGAAEGRQSLQLKYLPCSSLYALI